MPSGKVPVPQHLHGAWHPGGAQWDPGVKQAGSPLEPSHDGICQGACWAEARDLPFLSSVGGTPPGGVVCGFIRSHIRVSAGSRACCELPLGAALPQKDTDGTPPR